MAIWKRRSGSSSPQPSVTASKTGSAYATEGSIANSGNLTIMTGLPVRSQYQEQSVTRIAPAEGLRERDEELDELALFCTAPDPHDSFVWWRAGAWAGKSALMAWFVLHPPQGVRVVSFFITARLGDYVRRTAFVDVVMEQLLDMLSEPVPPFLTDATREPHLLALFERAAQMCQDKGNRLILVVDGLDEDRGVTAGPDARSIAGLLPARPPAGMRIIVAGRPHPPIPPDVDEHHPLCDPRIVRRLSRSSYASVVRTDMVRELRYLLQGTQEEQDLVGLLAAAVGGLTAEDLAALTNWSAWDITVEQHVQTVAGRSLSVRGNRWRRDTDVYLLGHDELHAEALQMLGPARVEGYRKRLHAWAQQYRTLGWPVGTPEYLLTGYFEVLSATNDQDRMIVCATDTARHNRLLDVSGNDYIALTQNQRIQQALFANPRPDYRVLIRLVLHQSHLAGRARTIPAGLPGSWARLGRAEHAENLARMLPQPHLQAIALATVVAVRADNADVNDASRLLDDAQACLSEINQDEARDAALVQLIWAAGHAGQSTRIGELIARVVSDQQRVLGMARAARAAAASGNHDRARDWCQQTETTSGELAEPAYRAQALAWTAATMAALGEPHQAKRLLNDAILCARASTQAGPQAASFAAVAEVAASTGLLDAAAVLRDAESLAHCGDDATKPAALAILSTAMAPSAPEHAGGLLDQAEELAYRIRNNSMQRAAALTKVAESALALGDPSRAERLVADIGNLYDREQALASLALHSARRPDPATAERFARSISTPTQRAEALTNAAWGWIESGEPRRAEAILNKIENQARTLTEFGLTKELGNIATEEAEVGKHDRAGAIAALITDDQRRVSTLSAIAQATISKGQTEHARQFLDDAEHTANGIVFASQRALALVTIAQAAGVSGDPARAHRLFDDAERAARTLDGIESQVRAMSDIASAAMSARDSERGHRLVDEAEHLSRSVTEPLTFARSMKQVVSAAASTGQLDRAERLLAEVGYGIETADVLIALTRGAAAAHDSLRLERFLDQVQNRLRGAAGGGLAGHLPMVSLIDLVMEYGDTGGVSRALDSGEQWVRTARHPVPPRHFLSKLAEAATKIGQSDRARTLLAESLDLDQVTDRAVETAVVLDLLGDTRRRDEVVSNMLRNGDWSSAATSLAGIDTGLRSILADDLFSISQMLMTDDVTA
jgi:hypothetical protein